MTKKKSKSKSKNKAEVTVAKKSKTILKRKQMRKDKRMAKKTAKKEFIQKKLKGNMPRQMDDEEIPSSDDEEITKQPPQETKIKKQVQKQATSDRVVSVNEKTNKDLKELQRQQKKNRKKQLLLANEAEEKNIKFLEKNLGLKRRKSKNLPKSFLDDGLDYLLDACDSTKIAKLENDLVEEEEENDDFDSLIDNLAASESSQDSDEDVGNIDSNHENSGSEEENMYESDHSEDENAPEDMEEDADASVDEVLEDESEEQNNEITDVWEDIYGRKRDVDGNIVNEEETKSADVSNPGAGSKYVPPALRRKASGQDSDEQKRISLERLAKQIKGLLNRLAESNIHGIGRDIERFYNSNSRNDVNNTLADLLLSSLVHESALIPARLIMEHCMLVAALHANVGTEVGAYILQQVVMKFDSECCKFDSDVGEEEAGVAINNLLVVISYLYAWRIVQCALVFDILNKLAERFRSKDIQLIILCLTNCGMSLRKDDPAALKNFIQRVQSTASKRKAEDSRVQFMLEVLNGIKNNNVNKIPNYDPSHFEHLKKNFKICLREGKFVTELNISYKDLIQAESKGRWWIVGSAFAGNLVGTQREDSRPDAERVVGEQFSDKLLDLARKMRMNTDIRRHVFCILMSAEDFSDAAEKLVKLGTKNQTEREVVFVVADCCLQEREYNPYYGHVAAKLASLDRKYRVAMQFNLWDRMRQVADMKRFQMTNLALLTKFLIIEKAQSLGLLKVIEFADLDKANMKLLKIILSGILQSLESDQIFELFKAVSEDSKLKMFRESLRLFLNHFLLKQTDNVDLESLKSKIKIAEKALMSGKAVFKL